MKSTPVLLLDSLSSNDATFFIPPYQRNYEWPVETCAVLLADVSKVAESNARGEYREHFFGSIVYVVEDNGFGVPDKYVLTDGQQRITTTMLLLMALRDSIEDETYRRTIQSGYLQNERADHSTEYKIKLKQVETDWEAYKALALGQDVSDEFKSSTVYQNYSFFKRSLAPLSETEKKNLLEHGLTKFSVISIQLEPNKHPWENPQEVFESMNSLGKPLSLADLVRNYLLMGKSSKEQTALYNNYWLPLERRLSGKLSEFLRDWMQADQHRSYKVASENNYKELYGAFKEIRRGRSINELFESFVRFSRPYARISGLEASGDAEIDAVIMDLNIIGIAPALSYLTEILVAWEDGKISAKEVASLLRAFRTYLLRRRVLGLTQGENKILPTMGERLPTLVAAADPAEELLNQFSSLEYAVRLPNDAELKAGLASMNFYNFGRSRNYPRLLLSLAEEHLTKARPNWDDNKLQLEHIMPQKLSSQWEKDLGENHENVHQELVNSLGNITLIRHNQELGNKSFQGKKITYAGRSGLQITQNYVLDRDVWDAAAIKRRRRYLLAMLQDHVLKIPEGLRHTSNWNLRAGGTGQFDSRRVLTQLIGETIHYQSNPNITATVISNAKVSFEGEEWSLSPLTTMLKERDGTANASRAYQGALYWTYDGDRLVDLDG